MHQLLPWYFNGTLAPGESQAFEEHLLTCRECRGELELMDGMRATLEQGGADLFEAHPTPEELLCAGEERDLEADRILEIRRHLALCLTCPEELEWLRGESVAAVAEEEPSGSVPSPLLPWMGWVGWAAAAILGVWIAVDLIGRPPVAPEREAGLFRIEVIRSIERDAAASGEVRQAPEAGTLHLLFEADLGPGSFPVSFEVAGPDGNVVFQAPELESSDLFQGVLLGFFCDRRQCRDGDYRARLSTSDSDRPDTIYSFRLATEASP